MSIATTSVTSRPAIRPSGPVVNPSPIEPQIADAVNEPIMNTSPWAKLISSMIP